VFGQFTDNLLRCRRPRIITINKDVVKDHGASRHSFDMVLDSSQSQGEVQLLASAVAQPLNVTCSLLPDRDQDRLVIISTAGRQAGIDLQV
jgi:hypothetical protein